mmetsp:Transcript_7689/g.8694  ORF Transcript_7689/g.8694 Transcript_7689/m.8694 type:complete len:80 (-) Transcript_7689:180-419(-)
MGATISECVCSKSSYSCTDSRKSERDSRLDDSTDIIVMKKEKEQTTRFKLKSIENLEVYDGIIESDNESGTNDFVSMSS